VAALGVNGHGYIIDDRTIRGSPLEWGRAAIAAYHLHQANLIVPEKNQGGDMVTYVIESIDNTVAIRPVHASHSKQARAEPISALYEQGRVHHVGMFAELEDQMCEWVPSAGMASPDRLDALVWALYALMLDTDAAENLVYTEEPELISPY